MSTRTVLLTDRSAPASAFGSSDFRPSAYAIFSIDTRGAVIAAASAVPVFRCPDHDRKADARAPARGGQRADDLAVFLERGIQLLDGRFEVGKIEVGLEQEKVLLLPYAFPEPVFLVLGQDLQDAAVQADLFGKRFLAGGGRLCPQNAVDPLPGLRHLFKGLRRTRLLHQPAELGHGVRQDIESVAAESDLPEAELIEQELEFMRQLRRFLELEHARQSLEGMDGAEQGIHRIGVDAARGLAGIEREQRLVRRFQNIFGFSEKLFYGTIGFCHVSILVCGTCTRDFECLA